MLLIVTSFCVFDKENYLDFIPYTVSDEITCGTESFYIISKKPESIKMLSKYNLNVGNNTQPEEYGKMPLMPTRHWRRLFLL